MESNLKTFICVLFLFSISFSQENTYGDESIFFVPTGKTLNKNDISITSYMLVFNNVSYAPFNNFQVGFSSRLNVFSDHEATFFKFSGIEGKFNFYSSDRGYLSVFVSTLDIKLSKTIPSYNTYGLSYSYHHEDIIFNTSIYKMNQNNGLNLAIGTRLNFSKLFNFFGEYIYNESSNRNFTFTTGLKIEGDRAYIDIGNSFFGDEYIPLIIKVGFVF